MQAAREFWEYIDRLVAASHIIIDRPKGSSHPRYPEFIYPLDYGYLDGTTGPDEAGIDVWLGSVQEKTATSLVLTIDLTKQDAEVKLLLACTPQEEQIVFETMSSQGQRAILVRRSDDELTVLSTRRSQRRFLPDPVPARQLERILEAATWAPSAHNRQPWRFAVLLDPVVKRQLAEKMGAEYLRDLIASGAPEDEALTQVQRSFQRIVSAPAGIVICLETLALDSYPDQERQSLELAMGIQGVAMAGQNMLLAASVLGLAGVWMCAPLFSTAAVRQALELPDSWSPQGLVLLGYPAREPRHKSIKPVAEVTRFY
jgi:F420 biosynthesis protein FbiB-like protein